MTPTNPPNQPDKPTVLNAPTENPVEKEAEIIDSQNEIEKAKAKITAAYKRKRLGAKTNRGNEAFDTAVSMATSPVEKIKLVWDLAVQKSPDQAHTNEINHKYKVQLDEAVHNAVGNGDDSGGGYLNKITAISGWLGPIELAAIQKSSALYFDLLASEGNVDIKEAMEWATGNGKPDQIEAGKNAYKTLKIRIPQEFPKGDNGLMPCLWLVMSFMGREDRDKLTTEYFAANPKIDKKAFLVKGNSVGVFTLDEMESLEGVTYANVEERKFFAETWQHQNDNRQKAIELSISSYGSENIAGKWMTLGNGIMRLAQAAAVLTIVSNVATDIFQGGKLKSASGLWDVITKPQIVGAGIGLVTINAMNSETPIAKTLEPQGTRENTKEKQGLQSLQKEISKYSWQDELGSLFDDEEARKAFHNYITREVKPIHEELNEGLVTAGPYFDFSSYLQRQSEKPDPDQKTVHFAELKKKFDGIKDKSNIIQIAKIFDQLQLGTLSPNDYRAKLEKAKNYNPMNPTA